MGGVRLYHGDCIEVMQSLKNKEKVNVVIADPPYGKTKCEWDSVIPFCEMWESLEALRCADAHIVLFGSEPFSSKLILSNLKNYKNTWIWHKNKPTNFWHAKHMPMLQHESIMIFYKGYYNPQKELYLGKYKYRQFRKKYDTEVYGTGNVFKYSKESLSATMRYPGSIQYFNVEYQPIHPTQKPLALMEYLINTYTRRNDIVLDFCMGSGTTGVAAKRLGRGFIGIEKGKKYFDIAQERIGQARYEPELFTEEET